MRKAFLVLLAAFAPCAAETARGALGSGAPPADGYAADGVSYARRGALGNDSYVVTNVYTETPCYSLAAGFGTNLVNRAVNSCTVTGDVAFVAPPAPVKRECDPFRAARAFLLVLEIEADLVPEVDFRGFGTLSTVDGVGIGIGKGTTILSFIEVRDGDFLVEAHELKPLNPRN